MPAVIRRVVVVAIVGAIAGLVGCQLLQPVLAPLPAAVDEGPFVWPVNVDPQPDGRVVVVVLTKTHGFRHDVIDVTADVVAAAARRTGLVPIVTADASVLDDRSLERVAVVVLAHANGSFATDEQFAALVRFVEGGGGLLLLHGAVGDWQAATPWLHDVTGARFIGHSQLPGTETVDVVVRRTHPIARHLPARFTIVDEIYAFNQAPRGALVVASLAGGTHVGGALQLTMPGEHPVLWTRAVADGDVVIFTPGHTVSTWQAPWMVPLLNDTLVFLSRRSARTSPRRR